MTKPKQLSMLVFIQLDNKRRCGRHAVATIQCLMRTPAWRKIKGCEFSDSGRSGKRLHVSGSKDKVMDTLLKIASLVKTAGDLDYNVELFLRHLHHVHEQVLGEKGRKFPEGDMMSFFL